MNTSSLMRKLIFALLLLSVGLLTACVREASTGPRAWIDSPRGGATIPQGSPITIVSHAYARNGIAEIVLYVNGEAYQRAAPTEAGATFSEFGQEWLATQPGTYSLQVRAYDINGDAGNPATISVNVVGDAIAEAAVPDVPEEPPTATYTPEVSETPSVTPIISDTPTLTATPTETSQEAACPPQSTALKNSNCRAGPGSAYEIIGSLSQGTSSTVVGRNNESSWWVTERPSGSGNCWIWAELVELSSNACDIPIVAAPPLPPTPTNTPTSTPTPTPTTAVDNTPPAAPAPQSPVNSATLSCTSVVTLSWSVVSDDSGIATYYIKLEKQISAGNWQSAGGFTSSTSQVDVPVDCGIIYRWAVRAEDGAVNFSDWSAFSQFAVNLN